MLRKISIAIVASAVSVLLAGGMANAESVFPSSGDEYERVPAQETYAGPLANEAARTGIGAESCFPSESSECGPNLGMENMLEPVGATEAEAAGGEVLPEIPSEWVTDD